jgi:hypothetical protein
MVVAGLVAAALQMLVVPVDLAVAHLTQRPVDLETHHRHHQVKVAMAAQLMAVAVALLLQGQDLAAQAVTELHHLFLVQA